MADISVSIDTHVVTQVEVQKYLEVIKRVLRVARGLAALTPTQLDDNVLTTAEKVVATIEPFVLEPWFAELVNFITQLFAKHDPATALMALRSVLTK